MPQFVHASPMAPLRRLIEEICTQSAHGLGNSTRQKIARSIECCAIPSFAVVKDLDPQEPRSEEPSVTTWQATYATPRIRLSLLGLPTESCDRQVKQEGHALDGWES